MMCVTQTAAFRSDAWDCPSLMTSSSHQTRLSRYPELSYRTHDRCHGDSCHLSSMTAATVFLWPSSAFFFYGQARTIMNLEFFFKVLTDGWAIGEILIALITTTGWKQGKVQDRGTQIILWVVIVASFR